MGAGIVAMHGTGMAALRMQPGICYGPLLFSLSLVIAVGAGWGALSLALRERQRLRSTPMLRGQVELRDDGGAGAHFRWCLPVFDEG